MGVLSVAFGFRLPSSRRGKWQELWRHIQNVLSMKLGWMHRYCSKEVEDRFYSLGL